MCNRFVQGGKLIKPGERAKVLMRGPGGTFEIEFDGAVFSGAARKDNCEYWLVREGGEEVRVPFITRYGERNSSNKAQGWEDVPEGSSMEGILLPPPPGKDYRLLKVVTQAARAARELALGNDRTPIFDPPLETLGRISIDAVSNAQKKPSDQLNFLLDLNGSEASF